MFKKILLLLITSPILASNAKIEKPTYLDLVRKCPGLETVSREQAAIKAFSLTHTTKCPALLEFLKHSLSPLEKSLGFEMAAYHGLRPATWQENLFGSGCYKWLPGRPKELLAKCHTEPEFASLLAKKYCKN